MLLYRLGLLGGNPGPEAQIQSHEGHWGALRHAPPDALTPSNYVPSNYPKLALTPVWPPHLCRSGFSTPTPPKTRALKTCRLSSWGAPAALWSPRKSSSSFPPQLAGGAHRPGLLKSVRGLCPSLHPINCKLNGWCLWRTSWRKGCRFPGG